MNVSGLARHNNRPRRINGRVHCRVKNACESRHYGELFIERPSSTAAGATRTIRIAGKLRKPAGAAEHCRQALMIVNPSFTLYKTFSIKCYSDHKHRIQWESREDWAGHAELLTEKPGLGGDPS